jgi:hypothetical protein
MSANKPMEIVGADFIHGGKLIVEFSDGTSTVYSVEQLMEMRATKSARANSSFPSAKVFEPLTVTANLGSK